MIAAGLPVQVQSKGIVGSAIKKDGGLKTCVCVFLCGIRLHRGLVWCSDISLATRIARILSICDGDGGQSNVNMVKDRDRNKPSSGFGNRKCYVCGKVGHFTRNSSG